MNIVFIGNFQLGPGGEPADETQLAQSMEDLGHIVYRIPRDEWREYVKEGCPEFKYKVPEFIPVKIDLIIVAKWHHFYHGSFIEQARAKYQAPVFYWVWDYMNDGGLPEWHVEMAKAADLYLSGELGTATDYKNQGIRFYYFQMDVGAEAKPILGLPKIRDVVYLGSHTNQNGRLDLLKAINDQVPIEVFAYDYLEWRKDGFKAHEAVYGRDFNTVVAQSKIVLGTSAGPHCYGYWSNRIGKTLSAGGRLLQLYAPGMELFLPPEVEYFSDAEEAIKKIREMNDNVVWKILSPDKKREFTSVYRVRQLMVMVERYLKEDQGKRWELP